MVEEKVTEAIIDVGKNVAEDIARPTSKSIGENLGLLVDGVMGWLGYWGQKQEIKREAYLADYKKKIAEKVAGIPEDKLTLQVICNAILTTHPLKYPYGDNL